LLDSLLQEHVKVTRDSPEKKNELFKTFETSTCVENT